MLFRSDRQTIWVAYRNDGTSFNKITPPWGTTASMWAAQFAEIHADEAQQALPTW